MLFDEVEQRLHSVRLYRYLVCFLLRRCAGGFAQSVGSNYTAEPSFTLRFANSTNVLYEVLDCKRERERER